MRAPPTLYVHTPRGDIAYQTVGSEPLDLQYFNPIGRSIASLWDYPPMVKTSWSAPASISATPARTVSRACPASGRCMPLCLEPGH